MESKLLYSDNTVADRWGDTGIWRCSYSPSGNLIALVSYRQVSVYKVACDNAVTELFAIRGRTYPTGSVVFSEDDSRLAIDDVIVDTSTGHVIYRMGRNYRIESFVTNDIVATSDVDDNQEISIWNCLGHQRMSISRCQSTSMAGTFQVTARSRSTNGGYLAITTSSTTTNYVTRMWTVGRPFPPTCLYTLDTKGDTRIRFSPTEPIFAMSVHAEADCTEDAKPYNVIEIWDILGTRLFRISDISCSAGCAFLCNGLAIGSSQHVWFWNYRAGGACDMILSAPSLATIIHVDASHRAQLCLVTMDVWQLWQLSYGRLAVLVLIMYTNRHMIRLPPELWDWIYTEFIKQGDSCVR